MFGVRESANPRRLTEWQITARARRPRAPVRQVPMSVGPCRWRRRHHRIRDVDDTSDADSMRMRIPFILILIKIHFGGWIKK